MTAITHCALTARFDNMVIRMAMNNDFSGRNQQRLGRERAAMRARSSAARRSRAKVGRRFTAK